MKTISSVLVFCCLTLSCSENEDPGQQLSLILDVMVMNGDEPLEVTFRSRLLNPTLPFSEEMQMKIEGKYLSLDEVSSCYWVTGSYGDEPEQWYFQQNVEGFLHTVLEAVDGEGLEWDCNPVEYDRAAVFSPISIFPRGGANILSQVRSMLLELGPVQVDSSEDEIILEWREIPQALKEDLLLHFNFPRWGSYFKVESVQLTMDAFHMVPAQVVVVFKDGASVTTDFLAIDFIHAGYEERVERLKRNHGIARADECSCLSQSHAEPGDE